MEWVMFFLNATFNIHSGQIHQQRKLEYTWKSSQESKTLTFHKEIKIKPLNIIVYYQYYFHTKRTQTLLHLYTTEKNIWKNAIKSFDQAAFFRKG